MEQVIINLAINAMNALDEFKLEDKNITVITDVEKGKCKIEMLDNGPGIPEENLEKIFYPFFTTKTSREGMGFGLSIAQNIINEMGGTISAYNRKTGGARFVILLPSAKQHQGE
jgi:two-component system C4-dicarboxylate transport sensor histidine kinase DctB